MGTPVPDIPVEWSTGKYYWTIVEVFQGGGGVGGCDQNYIGKAYSPITGDFIRAWIAAGLECVTGAELIPFTGYSAQRCVRGYGPYDTFEACEDDFA